MPTKCIVEVMPVVLSCWNHPMPINEHLKTTKCFSDLFPDFKGILWQFYKLVLKVPSGRDENDGIGHFAELGSSWPGEAKTWPKIVLRVGGRAEKYCVGGWAAGCYWAARPPTRSAIFGHELASPGQLEPSWGK